MIKGRMPSLACGPFLLALALFGCSEGSAPSSRENAQLDNAAQMLDEAPEALSDIDENSFAQDRRNDGQPAP